MNDPSPPWKPKKRLRHLKKVVLLNFAPEAFAFDRNLRLFYELYHVQGSQETLLFVSDQLPLESCLEWDGICWQEVDWGHVPLGEQLLHDPQGTQLRLCVFAAVADPNNCSADAPTSKAGQTAPQHSGTQASNPAATDLQPRGSKFGSTNNLALQRVVTDGAIATPSSEHSTAQHSTRDAGAASVAPHDAAAPILTQASIDAAYISAAAEHDVSLRPTAAAGAAVNIPTTSAPAGQLPGSLNDGGPRVRVLLEVQAAEPILRVQFEPGQGDEEVSARVGISDGYPRLLLHLSSGTEAPAASASTAAELGSATASSTSAGICTSKSATAVTAIAATSNARTSDAASVLPMGHLAVQSAAALDAHAWPTADSLDAQSSDDTGLTPVTVTLTSASAFDCTAAAAVVSSSPRAQHTNHSTPPMTPVPHDTAMASLTTTSVTAWHSTAPSTPYPEPAHRLDHDSFTFSVVPDAAGPSPHTPSAFPGIAPAAAQQQRPLARREPSIGSFTLRGEGEAAGPAGPARKVLDTRLDLNNLTFLGGARSDVQPHLLPSNCCVLHLSDGWYTPPAAPGARSPRTSLAASAANMAAENAEMARAASAMWEALPLLPGAPLAGFRGLMSKLLGQDWSNSPPPSSTPSRATALLGGPEDLMAEVAQRLRMAGEASISGTSGASTPPRREARGAPPAPAEKTYDVLEFRSELRRLAAAQERLSDAEHRRSTLRARVESLLEERERGRAAQQPLAASSARAARLRHEAIGRHIRLVHLQDTAAKWQQQLLGRAWDLQQRCMALQAARAELHRSVEVMEGDNGAGGLWRKVHADLVARRNRMLASTAAAYQIGPVTELSPLDRRPLDVSLDVSWWLGTPTFSANGSSPTSPLNSDRQGGGKASPGAPHSTVLHYPVGLSIAGLALPPNVALRGLEGSMGRSAMPDEEQRVAAALGYVAHAVASIAAYLDVPLRYPLLPAMSHSHIMDPAPTQLPTEHRKRGILDRRAVQKRRASLLPFPALPTRLATGIDSTDSDGPAGPSGLPGLAPRELPLFFEGWGGDRTRFAYAIFLLNKDLEQLLAAHGISSAGPSHVLENLYKLVLAASSALPPKGWPPRQQ